MQFDLTFAFEKGDGEGRYVRGWASVVSIDGMPFTDWSGDRIEIEDLRKAAHRFVRDARIARPVDPSRILFSQARKIRGTGSGRTCRLKWH